MSSTKPTYTAELLRRIYNDSTGEYIEVRPDADTGDLLEIRQVTATGETTSRIVGDPAHLRAVAQQILAATEEAR